MHSCLPRTGPVDWSRAQICPSGHKIPNSSALYPTLGGGGTSPDLTEYSIITAGGGPDRQNSEGALPALSTPERLDLLIPHASQLMSAIKDGLKDLGESLSEWILIKNVYLCPRSHCANYLYLNCIIQLWPFFLM